MKPFQLIIVLFPFCFSHIANADSSNRLKTDKLIAAEQSKSNITALAGTPVYQDVDAIGVGDG